VRKLIETRPAILDENIGDDSFMDSILKPHTSYAAAIKSLLAGYAGKIHGMAHITGGGIRDNLIRIINHDNIRALIDLPAVRVPPVFGVVRAYAGATDDEMLRTFNVGVGMILVADAAAADGIIGSLRGAGTEAYMIGSVVEGGRAVEFRGALDWDR